MTTNEAPSPARSRVCASPYRSALGDRCDQLPPVLRRFHEEGGVARGEFDVVVGEGWWRRTLARLAGFPAAGRVPVTLQVEAIGERQVWRRRLGDSRIHSRQRARDGLLYERFGPLCFAFELLVDDGVLHFRQRRVRFLGCPLPTPLAPVISASAQACGPNAWDVEVEIWMIPWERVVRYSGRMEVA
jgi:hypothetical protein